MSTLLIKKTPQQSLDTFVASLAEAIGCDRWEQRQSSHYVEERYFRCLVLGLEIIAAIADYASYPDYQFCLWFQPTGLCAAEKSFLDGLADCAARQFAVRGYEVLRPHNNRQGSGGVLYRLNPDEGAKPRERVVAEEI